MAVGIRELECFLVLADELHFGRTAERLYLSQSRVSQLLQSNDIILTAVSEFQSQNPDCLIETSELALNDPFGALRRGAAARTPRRCRPSPPT